MPVRRRTRARTSRAAPSILHDCVAHSGKGRFTGGDRFHARGEGSGNPLLWHRAPRTLPRYEVGFQVAPPDGGKEEEREP
jgi:hypothetical protein